MAKSYTLFILLVVCVLSVVFLSCCKEMSIEEGEAYYAQKRLDREFEKLEPTIIQELSESKEWISAHSGHKYSHWLGEYDKTIRAKKDYMDPGERRGHTLLKLNDKQWLTATAISKIYETDEVFDGGRQSYVVQEDGEITIPQNCTKEQFFKALGN